MEDVLSLIFLFEKELKQNFTLWIRVMDQLTKEYRIGCTDTRKGFY